MAAELEWQRQYYQESTPSLVETHSQPPVRCKVNNTVAPVSSTSRHFVDNSLSESERPNSLSIVGKNGEDPSQLTPAALGSKRSIMPSSSSGPTRAVQGLSSTPDFFSPTTQTLPRKAELDELSWQDSDKHPRAVEGEESKRDQQDPYHVELDSNSPSIVMLDASEEDGPDPTESTPADQPDDGEVTEDGESPSTEVAEDNIFVSTSRKRPLPAAEQTSFASAKKFRAKGDLETHRPRAQVRYLRKLKPTGQKKRIGLLTSIAKHWGRSCEDIIPRDLWLQRRGDEWPEKPCNWTDPVLQAIEKLACETQDQPDVAVRALQKAVVVQAEQYGGPMRVYSVQDIDVATDLLRDAAGLPARHTATRAPLMQDRVQYEYPTSDTGETTPDQQAYTPPVGRGKDLAAPARHNSHYSTPKDRRASSQRDSLYHGTPAAAPAPNIATQPINPESSHNAQSSLRPNPNANGKPTPVIFTADLLSRMSGTDLESLDTLITAEKRRRMDVGQVGRIVTNTSGHGGASWTTAVVLD